MNGKRRLWPVISLALALGILLVLAAPALAATSSGSSADPQNHVNVYVYLNWTKTSESSSYYCKVASYQFKWTRVVAGSNWRVGAVDLMGKATGHHPDNSNMIHEQHWYWGMGGGTWPPEPSSATLYTKACPWSSENCVITGDPSFGFQEMTVKARVWNTYNGNAYWWTSGIIIPGGYNPTW